MATTTLAEPRKPAWREVAFNIQKVTRATPERQPQPAACRPERGEKPLKSKTTAQSAESEPRRTQKDRKSLFSRCVFHYCVGQPVFAQIVRR
jgi:hypothetical protein